MIKSFLFFLQFLTTINCIWCQIPIDTVSLQQTLNIIFERDQKTRKLNDSIQFIDYIDSSNLVQAEILINKYGWLGKNFVGEKGNQALFLVIQHAELPIQEKYLPIFEKSVAEGESSISDYALLKDRILMQQGKKQIYGSQVVFNKTTGVPEFYAIEDEKNVNQRRKEVGLEPIVEYAKYFGIIYPN